MAGVDRHASAGRRHPDRGLREDLARLVDELQLLVGVIGPRREGARHGQHVERDLVRVDRGHRNLLSVEHGGRLIVQLLDRALTGAGHRLHRRDHEPLDAYGVLDRLQRHDHLHGRAVRVGDDPAVALERLGVHLGDDERHVVVHAPARRVVDYHGARLRKARRPLAGRAAPGREQRDVEALDRVLTESLYDQLLLPEVDLPAGRALGRERHHFVGRERPLAHDAEHRGADSAGRTHHGDPHQDTTGRWSPRGSSRRIAPSPSSNAEWSSTTARSTSASLTTHEILIGDVEIISMFTPALPSTVKVLAATPGWDFIPAPTSDTFPIAGSVATSPIPSSALSGSSASRALRRSSRGTVNDMSARWSADTGSFWVVMLDVLFAGG